MRTFSALLACSCCRACCSDPLRATLQGRQSWLIAIHARRCAAAITPDSQKMRAEPGLALPAAAGANFPAGSLVEVLLTQPHTTARPGAAAGCSQGEPTELRLAFIPAGPPGTPQHHTGFSSKSLSPQLFVFKWFKSGGSLCPAAPGAGAGGGYVAWGWQARQGGGRAVSGLER